MSRNDLDLTKKRKALLPLRKPRLFSYPMRACMLSHFSCVWLFVTQWTVAHETPLSMGFFRQEYWNGLPCLAQGGVFLNQGSNLHLLPFRQILYCWATREGLRTQCFTAKIRTLYLKKAISAEQFDEVKSWYLRKEGCRDFLGGPVFKLHLQMQDVWVRSLVRELRSHMPCSQKAKM